MTFEFLLVIIGLLVLWCVNLYVHWRGAKWLDEQKRKDRMMECDNDNKEVYMAKIENLQKEIEILTNKLENL